MAGVLTSPDYRSLDDPGGGLSLAKGQASSPTGGGAVALDAVMVHGEVRRPFCAITLPILKTLATSTRTLTDQIRPEPERPWRIL